MKRNSILFVAAFMTLLLSVSCGRNAEYVTSSYVTLHKTSYSISEEIGELKIPVLLKNAGGADAQVIVKVVEDTALEGVDYEIVSPANGILYFSGQTDSLDIVIEITPFRGEEGFTLDKDFSVEIQSVTDGIHLGSLAKTNITIVDLDHPLAPFVGEWTGVMTGKFDGTQYETTFKISSVRKDDTYVSLEDRVAFSEEEQPEIFVSIHVNSAVSTDPNGIETHWYHEYSKGLAEVIHKHMVKENSSSKDRGLFKSKFYVINHTTVPAVLCEIGFLSNEAERNELITEKRKQKTAKAIAEGIMEYLKNK